MGKTQKVGSLGEELVVRFLMKRGYSIRDRNYRRPWGELDVVAVKKNKIHFVEVKALSSKVETCLPRSKPSLRCSTARVSDETKGNVSSETFERGKALVYIRSKIKKDRFRAEDNVNAEKMKRLSRIIQTYLNAEHVSSETNWQFDVATVYIDGAQKKAKINFMEDLIL
ncbi:MAG: hypothetical protein EXS51_00145 [Candidatus Taylorbacteria bacterium]|nr:hypothetical protein [Candidatus Taylorbacteria bacterium]